MVWFCWIKYSLICIPLTIPFLSGDTWDFLFCKFLIHSFCLFFSIGFIIFMIYKRSLYMFITNHLLSMLYMASPNLSFTHWALKCKLRSSEYSISEIGDIAQNQKRIVYTAVRSTDTAKSQYSHNYVTFTFGEPFTFFKASFNHLISAL